MLAGCGRDRRIAKAVPRHCCVRGVAKCARRRATPPAGAGATHRRWRAAETADGNAAAETALEAERTNVTGPRRSAARDRWMTAGGERLEYALPHDGHHRLPALHHIGTQGPALRDGMLDHAGENARAHLCDAGCARFVNRQRSGVWRGDGNQEKAEGNAKQNSEVFPQAGDLTFPGRIAKGPTRDFPRELQPVAVVAVGRISEA